MNPRDVEFEILRRYVENEESGLMIREAMGVTEDTVRSVLEENGVKIRGRSEANVVAWRSGRKS